MKRQHKSGQAAMEFLMTYGWAILAAIIAIGVLAYFGVFNPSRLAGSAAVLNAPMNIGEFNILADAASGCVAADNDCINLRITQNSGSTLDLATLGSATITLTSGATGTCTAAVTGITSWTSGGPQTLTFTCPDTGAGDILDGTSMAGNIEIRYTTPGSTLVQTSTGNVRGVAQ